MNSKISSFTDLIAWKKAHELAVDIYKATDGFEKRDAFGLTSQMERSSLSISSNIAEGFGRQTKKDTTRFYVIARGSLVELQNQLLLARDTKRLSDTKFKELAAKSVEVHKLINGIIKSVEKVRND